MTISLFTLEILMDEALSDGESVDEGEKSEVEGPVWSKEELEVEEPVWDKDDEEIAAADEGEVGVFTAATDASPVSELIRSTSFPRNRLARLIFSPCTIMIPSRLGMIITVSLGS